MTMTPLLAPPEAQPNAVQPGDDVAPLPTEALAKPFRLGIVGVGTAIGLFARLSAANGLGELDSEVMMLAVAATSAIIGVGLALIAAERDRFGAPLAWIAIVTAAAWGALNWISPPFADGVTAWSRPDQVVLALVGVGNGLLLAGLVSLAFVRRGPTLTVAATMLAGLSAFVANTVLLRAEWPSIIALGVGFGLVLLAWDRSPRREITFATPNQSPRVSRAALSFLSVAFCGTALQLWISRSSIPRSLPAVILCVLLLAAAFASLVRVRREIERRETTLSEWTSWMREVRTNDFREQIQNFEADPLPPLFEPRPAVGSDGEAPRRLSFPGLDFAGEEPETAPAESTKRDVDDFDVHDLAAAAAELREPSTTIKVPSTDVASTERSTALPTADTPDIALPTADTPDIVLATADAPDIVLATADAPDIAGAAADTPEIVLPSADRVGAGNPTIALPAADVLPAAQAPAEASSGAFSSMLGEAGSTSTAPFRVDDLNALANWIASPVAASRVEPLLVAVEALSLDEFESLPPDDAAMATTEIGSFLADAMPTADLVSWIDGPYFIVAHASKPARELMELNRRVTKMLRSTNGTLAFLRPGADASLDDIVNQAVLGLLQARQHDRHTHR